MSSGIGEALVTAREALAIELDEVEERLKIRRRYLLAMEHEQWEKLPDPAYARGFLRTYADFLGLDGEALVALYRGSVESEAAQPPTEPAVVPFDRGAAASAPSEPRPGLPWGLIAGALVVATAAVMVIGGGDEAKDPGRPSPPSQPAARQSEASTPPREKLSRPPRAEVSFTATAPVWTCVVDQDGKPLLDGVTLAAGEKQDALRSKRLEMTFGNGQLELRANGKQVPIDSPADPVGYRVTADGVTELASGQMPTCG